jgi:hypothetical protein
MFKKPWIWLIGIVLLGIAARFIAYGYIKLPWIVYDEFVYLDTARQIVRGHFISAFTRGQMYPVGWPLLLATFVGFIHNPYVQYQGALFLTMVLSSLVPVFAFLLSGNLLVALLVTFYPPLFVYSSNILSETVYTLFLFGAIIALREIVRDDLRSRVYIILSGAVFGFMLYYIQITRSFGIVHFPALIAAFVFMWYVAKKTMSRLTRRNIAGFIACTVVMYLGCGLIARMANLAPSKLYEQMPYVTALHIILFKPLLFLQLLHNETVIVFVSLFWVLPVFFFRRTWKVFKEKKWHDVLARLFLVFVLLASFGLTVAHMAKTVQNNDQYLIFSRYMDPILVVMFAFALNDMVCYIKSSEKMRILSKYWIVVIAYFLLYLRFGYYFGQYKFGNTMPVYFLSLVQSNVFFFPVLTLFVTGLLWSEWKKHYRMLGALFIVFFLLQSVIAIFNTTSVPAFVQDTHYKVIREWNQALQQAGESTPICLMSSALWGETYYLYHFLYPYQYLKDCGSFGQNKPKWFIISATSAVPVPKGCQFTFAFTLSGNDGLFYCPTGIK